MGGGDLTEKRAWSRISDPLRMNVEEWRSGALPLAGQVKDPKRYWSSDFWAKKKGGINYRWNARRPTGFNLRSPTRDQAGRMTLEELATLAPTEKLDLYSGSYDYPLKREIARYARPNAPDWEGICNGWAEAASNHPEPVPMVATNPDGIQVPFGSSDIKALLSWHYFRKNAEGYARMGGRCYEDGRRNDACGQDMNAGAFHLVLTNRLGLKGESFTADIDRAKEVWNHIAYSYRSTVLQDNMRPRRSSARGTRKVQRIRTTVDYVFVLRRNSWDPVLGTPGQRLTKRTYDYYLEMGNDDRVIGGEWISVQRPDFIWSTARTAGFTGNMAKLGDLLGP